MTREDILQYLRSHKEEFKKSYKIEKIGLFGSYAREEATDESDIDIFVEMAPDLFGIIGLKQQIETELKKKVDIIRKHKHIKPLLLQMIQKDIAYV